MATTLPLSEFSTNLTATREWLSQAILENLYLGYLYGYPHKKAYQTLSNLSFSEVWEKENKEAMFLYLHIPFCNQKCSFCNLFSTTQNTQEEAYLKALTEEIKFVGTALGKHRFESIYLGGGTPTHLSPKQFESLFNELEKHLTIHLSEIPFCIESSPDTLTTEHLKLFKEVGLSRLSVGVESFIEQELKTCGRLKQFQIQEKKLAEVCEFGFEEINIDLIYGLEGQTIQSFELSLDKALSYQVESLFLYPLYIRPLTSYSKRNPHQFMNQEELSHCYDLALEKLTNAGYQQESMRKFKRPKKQKRETNYECQVDPMLGLGAGSRSYTKTLHYSTPWRMKPENINQIIGNYIGRLERKEYPIFHGIILNQDEQIRRFSILSLLYNGVDFQQFQTQFQTSFWDYFKIPLQALKLEGCIEEKKNENLISLTPKGRKHSDIVGHLFFSQQIQESIQYEVSH